MCALIKLLSEMHGSLTVNILLLRSVPLEVTCTLGAELQKKRTALPSRNSPSHPPPTYAQNFPHNHFNHPPTHTCTHLCRQLPTFLEESSAAWQGAYTHVFLIREPIARAFSAINFFSMHSRCKLSSVPEFLRRFLDADLPIHDNNACHSVVTIASEQLGNFYVKHLTGRGDALSLALRRLNGMHILDMTGLDPPCRLQRIMSIFGINTIMELPAIRVQKYDVPEDQDLLDRLRMRMLLDIKLYEHVASRLREGC